jgi:hypothetical protein
VSIFYKQVIVEKKIIYYIISILFFYGILNSPNIPFLAKIYSVFYYLIPIFFVIIFKNIRIETKPTYIILFSVFILLVNYILFLTDYKTGFNHWSYIPTFASLLVIYIILLNKYNFIIYLALFFSLIIVLQTNSLKAISVVFFIIVIKILSKSTLKLLLYSTIFFLLIYFLMPEVITNKLEIYVDRYVFNFFTSPRGILYIGGFLIALNYFPLGSGIGTYGSPAALIYRSPEYEKFNLGGHGLEFSKIESNNFFYDAYWSGVIGELGFILFVIYISIYFKAYWKENTSVKLFFLMFLFQSLWTHFINDFNILIFALIIFPLSLKTNTSK